MGQTVPQRTATSAGSSAPIDLVYLARQTAGDHDLEQELLALFADQCVRHLETIRSASANQGTDAAHTLKGAARAIGAWGVADAADRVERALGEGARPDALAELDRATQDARAVIRAMREAA